MIEKQGPILEVRDLVMHFHKSQLELRLDWPPARMKHTTVYAVNGVSFELYPGETLGVVGESGCGKSTTARATLQLHRPTGGEVLFKTQNLCELSGEVLRRQRRRVLKVLVLEDAAVDEFVLAVLGRRRHAANHLENRRDGRATTGRRRHGRLRRCR